MNLFNKKKNVPVSTKNRHHPFWDLQSEMNQLFDNFFTHSPAAFSKQSSFSWPSIEVKDQGASFLIKAEVPGLNEDDIELNFHNNMLEISGEKREEKEETTDKGTYSEMSYGKFHRAIPFEHEINPENVKATMKNGVLRVTLEKTEEHKTNTRKINITT